MSTRAPLLALVCGCTVADLTAAGEPDESQLTSRSTIAQCPTGQWCVETPASMMSGPRLHGVWAVDADNVFAVGDNGTILQRIDGNDWTSIPSGTTSNLRTVWGSSPTNVWAGGGPGTILHYDGTSWSQVSAQIASVDSIWGSSANNVWIIGATVVLRWNGSSFTTFGIGGTLLSVSGTSPTDVWVTGESTWVRRYNGTSWGMVMPTIGSSMYSVLALTPTDVWVSGPQAGKETSHYNGVKWTTFRTAPLASDGVPFMSMSALGTNDVWGAGNSKIGHWNGTAWSLEEPFGNAQTLWAVSTVPGHVWIVGDDGLIVHRRL